MDSTALRAASADRSGAASPFTGSEERFYGQYEWCLNPFLSVDEVLARLRSEADHLKHVEAPWEREEVTTNVFLLACAVSDSLDDLLEGKRYSAAAARKFSPALYRALSVPEKLLNAKQRLDGRRLGRLRAWRREWRGALHRLLLTCAKEGPVDAYAYARAVSDLVSQLGIELPSRFLRMRIKSPRAFRSQDFTFEDILTLARRFCEQHAEPGRPCLVIGLRTAGSYFGPVLRAYMENAGYSDTDYVTLRPKKGAPAEDLRLLRSFAARGGSAVIIDEPVFQGITLGICMEILRGAGFAPASVSVIFPVHPAARDWRSTNASVVLKGCRVVTVEPEETTRHRFLEGTGAQELLRSYFTARGASSVTFVEDDRTRQLNEQFRRKLGNSWHTRLRHAWAVQLTKPGGEVEVRRVVAKSIGLGWNSYQAYFAARSLAEFVPEPLGLRHGCLFSEWVEASAVDPARTDRAALIDTVARYVAARVQGLRFVDDPSPALCEEKLQLGSDDAIEYLSRSYGSKIVGRIKKGQLRKRLAGLFSPYACLVDGKMGPSAWLDTGTRLVKTGFEDHAMGRMEASVTDPAADLAGAITSFALSAEEERALLGRYADLTGDSGAGQRLPLYQLLAHRAQLDSALAQLNDAKLAHLHPALNRQFVEELTAATTQMARFCAGFIPESPRVQRRANGPLVFLDVDGVIDRNTFFYPTTTQSGVRGLAVLRSHGVRTFLNTARSCHDVQAYCAVYGLDGAVAESGSWLWDAVTQREQALVEPESLAELQRVREALEKRPGVFTNHLYRYSIKAHTYGEGGTKAVPEAVVDEVLAQVGARTLSVHHTSIDTAITSAAVNKGTGLQRMAALLDANGAETIAVGDTWPDLAMFRVASRCYAPSHTWVRDEATALGCRVVKSPYQAGFLEIARHITHPEGGSCRDCVEPRFEAGEHGQALIDFLGDIESSKGRHLMRAMLDPRSIDAIFT